MADKIIQMKSLDKENDFYPNIKDKNIPDKSITGSKLVDDLSLKNVTISGTMTLDGKDSLILKDGSTLGGSASLPIYYPSSDTSVTPITGIVPVIDEDSNKMSSLGILYNDKNNSYIILSDEGIILVQYIDGNQYGISIGNKNINFVYDDGGNTKTITLSELINSIPDYTTISNYVDFKLTSGDLDRLRVNDDLLVSADNTGNSSGIYIEASNGQQNIQCNIAFKSDSDNGFSHKVRLRTASLDFKDDYDIIVPYKSGTLALTSDIPTYYRHTIKLKTTSGAVFCFMAESKKNTKIDSLTDLFTLFANTDICGWGYKSATEVYNCIHIGASSTDTTLFNAITGEAISFADSGYDSSVEDTIKEI